MTNESGAPTERANTARAGAVVLAVFLMSYPWLAPSLQGHAVLGVPLLLVYFFGVWALCIVLAAYLRADA